MSRDGVVESARMLWDGKWLIAWTAVALAAYAAASLVGLGDLVDRQLDRWDDDAWGTR